MMIRAIAATALMLIPTVLSAAQTTYVCKVKAGDHGWIADELVIGLDDADGRVIVADPIILYAEDGPIAGRLTENTAKKRAFRWELALTSRTGQTTKMKYRAALQFPSMRLLISARPAGYANNFTARGACAISDQKLPNL